jgi:putative iron-regulated protein
MRPISLAPLALVLAACGSSSTPDTPTARAFPKETATAALETYKKNTLANYDEVVTAAEALKAAIDAFVAAPSESTFDAAKAAWIAARAPYGPSEAHRFYDGPIDEPENGPEGAINAWPLDEFHIDYTRETPTSGIVNDPKVTIDAATLTAANERDGEKAITTGYHAIEFLLWGQDDEQPGTGPGKRPFTDFVDGGTASNQARRRAYLAVTAGLLVDDLKKVRDQWRAGDGSFAAQFGIVASDPKAQPDAEKEAIGKLLRALGSMAKAELSGERMTVAFKNRSQEDEHSCFSDTTATDLLGNGLGIEGVWLGRYGSNDGPGLDDVVRAVDGKLADKTTADLAAAVALLRELDELQKAGTPIDVILAAPDADPNRKTMREAIAALKTVGEDVEAAAKALGLSIQLEQPSEDL